MTKNNEQIEKIYICNYGQTEFPVCVDLGHEYCKLDFQKSKECNLRAVVSYDDYLRKEQECEELKAKCKKYGELNEQETKDYAELKAENERLQEEREKAKNYNLEYGQLLIKATNKNNKLSKTLAEIKEIAEDTKDKFYDAIHTGGLYERLEQIIRKINEVIDD